MVKLRCKLGTNNIKVIEVNPSDPLNILLQKLNISDKHSIISFKTIPYSIRSIQTFREIGITFDTKIHIMNQAIGGGRKTFTDISKKIL